LAGDPTDERSECRLGDIAARGSDLKDAASYYSRALEMQPNDPDAHLGMAKIQMSNHEPQKAVTHLERAAQIEPFNPGTHYRLGVVYRELGRADDSHREMTRFEELKKMKSRLGDLYQEMRLQPGKKRDESDSDVMR
jgi:Flp pilus assembly protein TadD